MNGLPAVLILSLLALVPMASAESLCLAPAPNVTVDCDPLVPAEWPNAWTGYTTDEESRCQGNGCLPPPQIDCYCGNRAFNWTISASATSPNETEGPVVETLYLWLECTAGQMGMRAARFDFDGTLKVVEFEPLNGFQNAGTATELTLFAPDGCTTEGLVGRITVAATTPVRAETWGRVKSAYRQTLSN